ncbi:hypothetical protein MLD38_004351 [Melastoma candidum]|uniref:Uncharacterized protein n=1 Tax=Melastoma candidum TaxID=119954 RepID=A0ACB9S9B3_9MYRT|nr:hypothetical protein MLD38_004351 [Melastoma candidum]
MAAKATHLLLLLLPRLSLLSSGRRCCHRCCSISSCYTFPSLSTAFYSSSYRTTPAPLARLSSSRFVPPPSSAFTSPSLERCFGLSTRSAPSGDDDADLGSRYIPSPSDDLDDGDESIDEWEEDEDYEPKIGDGADGGGIVLQNVPWGEHALSIAQEVLSLFGDDMKLFAFRTTPRGYIYVRIDKLSNKYGCPDMEEIESYSHEYKKRLDEAGSLGKLPDNLALEVSSPGAERLLKVPDDLSRFQDMAMVVTYVEGESINSEKTGVFFLDSVETESATCVWRLADVKENRDPQAKGRPLSRKQKDWRLKLPHAMCRKVTLHIDS